MNRPAATEMATAPGLARTRLIAVGARGLLIAALVCAPLSLVVALLNQPDAASGADSMAVAASPDPRIEHDRATAGEFAARVVMASLSATTTDHQELHSLVGRVPVLSTKATPATDARVVSVTSTAAGWSVVVSAAVGAPAVRRYFEVPVRVDGEKVAALTLPALIPGPRPALAGEDGYGERFDAGSAPVVAAEGFLGALLCGSGDITRYVVPESTMIAVTPPPFTSVDVVQAMADHPLSGSVPADGDALRLKLTTNAVAGKNHTLTLTYLLTLHARAGRWEVATIDTTPLAAAAAIASPNTTPTPTNTSNKEGN